MSLKKLAEKTTSALVKAVPDHDFSNEEKQAIQSLIEDSFIKTVKEARKAHTEAALSCCEPDMAHKIADEARRTTNALIANLSAMR